MGKKKRAKYSKVQEDSFLDGRALGRTYKEMSKYADGSTSGVYFATKRAESRRDKQLIWRLQTENKLLKKGASTSKVKGA